MSHTLNCGCVVMATQERAAVELCPLHASAEAMLQALRYVDRLYSELGGEGPREGHYKLLANDLECGPMINAVREAIAAAEAGKR